jgi:hypothetical protein
MGGIDYTEGEITRSDRKADPSGLKPLVMTKIKGSYRHD